ncbi:MAG: phosphonate C-P lyase system protein PhnG [Alsobacter sp.]
MPISATHAEPPSPPIERRRVMALAARATLDELRGALAVLGAPDAVDLRPIETGLVMLRGRTGGDGAPVNLGEATVTRAAVRIPSGEVGFAYLLGRDAARARAAAVLDAMAQRVGAQAVADGVLAGVRARVAAEDATAAARAAATKVDFFTMVRGED